MVHLSYLASEETLYAKDRWLSSVKVRVRVLVEWLFPALPESRTSWPSLVPTFQAVARVRSHRQPVKILGDGFACREGVDRDQAQDHDQRQQHGENSFLHNFFPFLKFCFFRQSFPSRSKKRARTAATVRVRALL